MLAGLMLLAAAAAPATVTPLPPGQRHYLQSCGGCHGLAGISARREIPVLRDRVGLFLCTPETRDYVVRLPNVAFAAMDDATLAGALNFMMFQLGGASVPADARPFAAREVGALRARPLKARDVVAVRDELFRKADRSCSTGTDLGRNGR